MFNSKKLAGLAVGLSLFAGAGMAQAASLNSTQISAILSLLSSFGADQGTINSVSTALGGTPASSSLTCSSFSDVSYGQFDNNPGGRVSQLQTWLGIPSNTFGFGTYGNKTQAAWSSRCGGVTPTQSTSFAASPISGAAPLTVTFTAGQSPGAEYINYGDGSPQCVAPAYDGEAPCNMLAHTYTIPGVYTATLYRQLPSTALATQTITVTGAPVTTTCGTSAGCVVNQPSATIDQSSLRVTSNHPTITGTATGVSQVFVAIVNTSTGVAYGDGFLGTNHDAMVSNGRWSFPVAGGLANGTYTVTVQSVDDGTNMAHVTGTLTVQ